MKDVSPVVQKAITAMLDDQKALFQDRNSNGATSVTAEYVMERIPVAPAGHTLYVISLTGEFGCIGNSPNCRTAVLDETTAEVAVIDDNGFAGIAVVRRPHLQMPDIAFYEQEGHFGMSTTVYRYDGAAWKPFRCAYAPMTGFPPKRVVADQPCKP